MSFYFKKHHAKYLQKLFSITDKQDWEGWISFFLKGVVETGKRLTKQAKKLHVLSNHMQLPVKDEKISPILLTHPVLKTKERIQLKKFHPKLKLLEEKKWIHVYKKKPIVIVTKQLSMGS